MTFDRIELVRYRVGTGSHGFVGDCVDIRINGASIIPLDEHGDHDLAGLTLDDLRARLGEVDVGGGWRRTLVLRCTCGDLGCANAVVELRGTPDEILWRDAEGSTRQGRGASFRFARDQWRRALAAEP